MNSVAPRDIIEGFFLDMNKGDAKAAFGRLASDVAYQLVASHPHGGVFDASGIAAIGSKVFERLAGPLKISIARIVAEGEHVAVEAKGHAPTKKGGTYANHYLFLYRVVDGRIIEAREFLDSAMYVDLVEGRL